MTDLENLINRQGARIVALESELREREVVMMHLAGRAGSTRFPKREREEIAGSVERIGWRELADGTLVVKVEKRKRGHNGR